MSGIYTVVPRSEYEENPSTHPGNTSYNKTVKILHGASPTTKLVVYDDEGYRRN